MQTSLLDYYAVFFRLYNSMTKLYSAQLHTFISYCLFIHYFVNLLTLFSITPKTKKFTGIILSLLLLAANLIWFGQKLKLFHTGTGGAFSLYCMLLSGVAGD